MRKKKANEAKEAPVSGANAEQIGGSHYKSKFEHWDLVEETGMGYLEANCSRYVVRWRAKDGLEGLKKAHHYARKLLEVVATGKRVNKAMIGTRKDNDGKLLRGAEFCQINSLTKTETDVVLRLINWQTSDHIQEIMALITGMIDGYDGYMQHNKVAQF